MPGRHLLLATAERSFGEVLVGRQLARELHAAGHEVTFLHPRSLSLLLKGEPYRTGTIDLAMLEIAGAIAATVRDLRIDTIVLVDVTTVLYSIGHEALIRIVHDHPRKVFGLDLWNLGESTLVWDVNEFRVPIHPSVLHIPALHPAPICRPEAPHAFRWLPFVDIGLERRSATRARLGVSHTDRVIMTTTATWQHPRQYAQDGPRRLAAGLAGVYELLMRRLPPTTHLVHVGPEPFGWAAGEERYHHHGQLASEEFHAMLAAAELFLSLNVSATSIAAAIALGVPVALVTSGLGGATSDELEAATGRPLPDDLRAWCDTVVPMRPYRVWPIGLHAFVAPVLADNPYRDCFAELELLDIDGTAATIAGLLEQGPTREAIRAGQAAYQQQVATLPSALDAFITLVGG